MATLTRTRTVVCSRSLHCYQLYMYISNGTVLVDSACTVDRILRHTHSRNHCEYGAPARHCRRSLVRAKSASISDIVNDAPPPFHNGEEHGIVGWHTGPHGSWSAAGRVCAGVGGGAAAGGGRRIPSRQVRQLRGSQRRLGNCRGVPR